MEKRRKRNIAVAMAAGKKRMIVSASKPLAIAVNCTGNSVVKSGKIALVWQ